MNRWKVSVYALAMTIGSTGTVIAQDASDEDQVERV